jgi:hypothetical protein
MPRPTLQTATGDALRAFAMDSRRRLPQQSPRSLTSPSTGNMTSQTQILTAQTSEKTVRYVSITKSQGCLRLHSAVRVDCEEEDAHAHE